MPSSIGGTQSGRRSLFQLPHAVPGDFHTSLLLLPLTVFVTSTSLKAVYSPPKKRYTDSVVIAAPILRQAFHENSGDSREVRKFREYPPHLQNFALKYLRRWTASRETAIQHYDLLPFGPRTKLAYRNGVTGSQIKV